MTGKVLGLLVLVTLVGGLLPFSALAEEPPAPTEEGKGEGMLQLVDEFGEGKLYRANGIPVLQLSGTFSEMGRQYGSLLKPELNDFYAKIQESASPAQKQALAEFVDEISSGYGERQLEVFRGMASTSGLSVTQLLTLDQSVATSLLEAISCSFIAAWGPYTHDGTLIAGRNFDWFKDYRDMLSPYLCVIAYNPSTGGHAAATVNFAGMVNGLTALNDQGLLIEMNNGMNSVGRQIYLLNRTSYMNDMLDFMWDAGSLKALGKMVETTRTMSPVIITMADSGTVVSYENAPFETRKRSAEQEGLLVVSNHYMLPEWGLLPLESATQSLERYKNLLARGEEHKGQMNVEQMKSVMELTIAEGGATEIAGSVSPTNPDLTIYQVVAVPAERRIWVRSPNYDGFGPGWTEIDLNALFVKGVKRE